MLCFVFSALIVVLDQLFKRWITITMAVGEQKSVIPGIISLAHVENYGAAFSILSGKRWLLAAIMFVAIIIIVAILLRYNEGFWGTLGLSAVLGGAVGNLIDRVFNGHVVDMFEFKFMEFAIFNVADIFITLGGLTFLIFFIVTSFKPSKTAEGVSGKADGGYDAEDDDSYDQDEYEQGEYDYDDYDEDYEDDYDDDDVKIVTPKPYLRPTPPRDPSTYEETPLSPFAPIRTPKAPTTQPAQQDTPLHLVGPLSGMSEPLNNIDEPRAGASSLLDELGLLESDLEGAEIFDDSDIDELLREYGFEDDDTLT